MALCDPLQSIADHARPILAYLAYLAYRWLLGRSVVALPLSFAA